jgi:hypothetical protein
MKLKKKPKKKNKKKGKKRKKTKYLILRRSVSIEVVIVVKSPISL